MSWLSSWKQKNNSFLIVSKSETGNYISFALNLQMNTWENLIFFLTTKQFSLVNSQNIGELKLHKEYVHLFYAKFWVFEDSHSYKFVVCKLESKFRMSWAHCQQLKVKTSWNYHDWVWIFTRSW